MHKIMNFHEGHSTVGEWQGSCRLVAGERHGMCESAFTVFGNFRLSLPAVAVHRPASGRSDEWPTLISDKRANRK
jgi:hypothetical protein